MQHTYHQTRMCFLTLVLVFLMSWISSLSVSAAKPNFVITGEFDKSFTLYSNGVFFDEDGMIPGRVYSSTVELNNAGIKPMHIYINKVTNVTDTPEVLSQFSLTISHNDEILYDGLYSDFTDLKDSPIRVSGESKEILQFDVKVSESLPNGFGGMSFKSEWEFYADYMKPRGGDDSEDLPAEIDLSNEGSEVDKPDGSHAGNGDLSGVHYILNAIGFTSKIDYDGTGVNSGVIVGTGNPSGSDNGTKPAVNTGIEYMFDNTVSLIYLVVSFIAFIVCIVLYRQQRKTRHRDKSSVKK